MDFEQFAGGLFFFLLVRLAISIFSGSTQFVITWLIGWMNNPLAPAFYWSAVTAVGLIAILGLKESAPLHRR